ncbi:hypothetical protein COT62_02300, partial [Candidatus Roizmanbacteria bacterium CG09_land_8_20_14_0_10_41_9]
MTKYLVKSRFFNDLCDKFIPLLSWVLITLPLWLSPFHPAVVAYFIITFDIYFFYKCIKTAYYASISYRQIISCFKVDFSKKIKPHVKLSEIYHFVIIPNYQEPLYKLESSIVSITKSDFPLKHIILVLAFEQREQEAIRKAHILKKKFKYFFNDVIESYHVLCENEIPGKASNQTSAAKIVDSYVQKNGWDRKNILITISDADSHFSKNYFSYLTHEFFKDKNRLFKFYWAPVLLYNNFWQLPFFVRIQATLSSILRLAFLSERENLIQISTYSTNLWLLKEVNFWDVDIIPEDWHIFFQAFFTFGDKIKTMPLYTIVNGDAVYSGGIIKTLLNRYEQEKRWAWGVSDVGYTLRKFFTTPHINPVTKLKRILYLAENHLFWPTSFFILTISASIPPLINPIFKRTVLGFLLPQLSGLILTLSSLMLVLYMYLDIKLRKKIKVDTEIKNMPFLIIQWYLLPVISFLLSSLPALDAHTRLLF